LLQHVDQCMQHEDVVKYIYMPVQLAHTLTEWHCNLFIDLIDEIELWLGLSATLKCRGE